MNVRNLFQGTYWFKQPVIATHVVFYVWLFGLLVMVAAGIACFIWCKFTDKRYLQGTFHKAGNFLTTMGIVGLVFFFFRQQSVPFLGWRFWFLGWGIIAVVWAFGIIKYFVKRVPEIKAEQDERARKEKYLPTSK